LEQLNDGGGSGLADYIDGVVLEEMVKGCRMLV